MAEKSFLSYIKKNIGKGGYAGDEFGGGAGRDGSGLPANNPGNFMFATGIECSYPTIGNGKIRRDLLEECGHYKNMKQDLGLVKELGLNVLRYGLPYYSISKADGKYDWSFADEAMNEIKRLGITPILDLMHFGVPDWVGNFQNPELPIHFAKYAAAVAKRYPWVRFYTPVNEIFVTAKASARDGLWNEQLKNDRGFVNAIKNLVASSIMANHQIARQRPDCIIVQSESAEYVHEFTATVSKEIILLNKLRFLSLDLLYAHPPDADVCMYLFDNGLTRDEYEWFMAGEPPGYQVMGNDYYGRNERIKLPVMHTETNVLNAEEASVWLYKQWINVLQIRRDGIPVLGFTWYSLIDQVDWDIELAEKKGTVNACGLYGLDRKPRPVAQAYKMLLEQFGRITIVPYGEVFELTDRQAELKVEV